MKVEFKKPNFGGWIEVVIDGVLMNESLCSDYFHEVFPAFKNRMVVHLRKCKLLKAGRIVIESLESRKTGEFKVEARIEGGKYRHYRWFSKPLAPGIYTWKVAEQE